MKKTMAFCLALLLCFLSGCQPISEKPVISGTVAVVYGDNTIVSENIETQGVTAEDVLLEVCQKNKIPYRLDNHMFDGFGGFDSTETDGWILYINNQIAEKGAYAINLEDSFNVTFSYVNYNEVFAAE